MQIQTHAEITITFEWGTEILPGAWLPGDVFRLSKHSEYLPLGPGDTLLASREDGLPAGVATSVLDLTGDYMFELCLVTDVEEDMITQVLSNLYPATLLFPRGPIRCSGYERDATIIKSWPGIESVRTLRSPGDVVSLDDWE